MSMWTSAVSNTTMTSGSAATGVTISVPVGPGQGGYSNIPPNPYWGQPPNIPGYVYPPGSSGVPTPITVKTSQQPVDGMVALINGKYYRYSEAANEWHELIDAAETEIAEAPILPIELDASAMLDAFEQYRTFLEDLDGLDSKNLEIVEDTLFGLREAINALKRLG